MLYTGSRIRELNNESVQAIDDKSNQNIARHFPME